MLGELWRQYKYEGNAGAREELVVKCLPVVKSLARRFATYTLPCCDADDLVSVGIIGLLDALEKYDPVMQATFETYAKYRIRGAILDEIRNLKWTPRSIQEKVQTLKKAHNYLEQRLARPPTEEELADALDVDLKQFRKMLVQIGPSTILTLCQNHSGNDGSALQEIPIEDPNAIDSLRQLISNETRSILANAISALPKRESIVITLYYYEEMTMREIGEILSRTESRICQIHASALLNLFQTLNTKIMVAPMQVHQVSVAD